MSDINLGDNMVTGAVGATDDLITITSTGISPYMNSSIGTISIDSLTMTMNRSVDELLEDREMNLLVTEHKLQEQELLKLKDNVPDYAEHIKNNIAKEAAKELVKKMTFTKKKLPDSDTHQFLGRIYVFTKEELIELIKDARNA